MDVTGSINNEDLAEAIENEEDVDYSEERELVEDSCSTKVLDTCEEPRDRYRIVYILFYLFGISSLVPWNFLITANDYWMYKFRDVKPSNLTMFVRKTQFQAEFTSYLNVATAIPNLIFLILNSLYGHCAHRCAREASWVADVCESVPVAKPPVQVSVKITVPPRGAVVSMRISSREKRRGCSRGCMEERLGTPRSNSPCPKYIL
ncbi:jg20887 [Pararge aegeria aegeria]|uniref:Jg20887 protein n=2 Tax=Pararge aegeria TaxID=116150 RepID=A0A8S4RJ53_9NEOP|nr:jg20887 [Pararge aegeria aegeria]